MPRLQPSLTQADVELVDRLAEVTRSKRSDVIRDALAVYHWFVRHAVVGASVVARAPSGRETCLATPEFAALESRAGTLSPDELGRLAKELEECADPARAEILRDQLTRGFYGI